MHTENGVHALQSAPLHILLRLAADLLGHLENELYGAPQLVPVGLEDAGGAQKHGGVAVVAAGVHDPGIYAAVGFARVLLDGQSVDVRPEHDGLSGLAPGDGAHAAGDPLKKLDRDAHGFQLSLDEAGGLHLVLPQLGVGVEVTAGLDDIILLLQCQFTDIHFPSPPAVCSR